MGCRRASSTAARYSSSISGRGPRRAEGGTVWSSRQSCEEDAELEDCRKSSKKACELRSRAGGRRCRLCTANRCAAAGERIGSLGGEGGRQIGMPIALVRGGSRRNEGRLRDWDVRKVYYANRRSVAGYGM